VKVSFVLVNYNDWHFLDPCLASIYRFKYPWPFEIIVTDNGSSNQEAKRIVGKYPDVIVIEAGENLGFAKANNLAIKRAKGDYIFVLNGDTELIDNNIANAIRYMDKNTDVGMLGPELLNQDGTHQTSTSINNDLAFRFFSILKASLYLDKFSLKKNKEFDSSKIQQVGFILGAAMLVRREVIDKVGVFDERFFFSAEERDWCYRTLKTGFKIIYYPDWRIIHFGGSTGGGLWYMIQFHKATMLYYEKYWGFIGRFAVKISFLTYALVRFMKTLIARLIKPSDKHRREFETHYGILKWHLGITKAEHISRVR